MGANRTKAKDKGVGFDTFRKLKTMTKKLKIRFIKLERAFAMQILEQKGVFNNTRHVLVDEAPFLLANAIFLRGSDRSLDFRVCNTQLFTSNKARDQSLDQIIRWISKEQFRLDGKLEIGKNCEVSDDGEVWLTRIFAGKCAAQLGEPRFLVLDGGVSLTRWKYARPIASCVQPQIDGDLYTWEMEVAE